MSNFWDIVWLMVSTFFFIAYLFILFQVVIDLFRDTELAGGYKVLWMIGLVFVPVLTAAVYIIARGEGMSHRQRATLEKTKSETDAYIKACRGKVAGGTDLRRKGASRCGNDHAGRVRAVEGEGARLTLTIC